MIEHHKGTDPLHDLAGYHADEIYFLADGRIVTKKSWDGPLIGWEFLGAVFLGTTLGIVDNLSTFNMNPLGYRVIDSACSFSYAKVDETAMTQEEFDAVVERLRQEGYAVENFQLVEGLFWLNYVATTQQEEPAPVGAAPAPFSPAQPEENA